MPYNVVEKYETNTSIHDFKIVYINLDKDTKKIII